VIATILESYLFSTMNIHSYCIRIGEVLFEVEFSQEIEERRARNFSPKGNEKTIGYGFNMDLPDDQYVINNSLFAECVVHC